MKEFLKLVPPSSALREYLRALPEGIATPTERIRSQDALDRVLRRAVRAPHPLPAFRRSTVDGFAVRSADTYGASATLPAYLRVVGEVLMGRPAGLGLAKGESAQVHTGGMIPDGADAVVMVEDTQVSRDGEVEVLKPAALGQNVLAVGEDVQAGEVVLESGARLRPAEIGGLAALGLIEVEVARRPKVGLLSTGDEVVPAESEPQPGQVRDVNSPMLAALVRRAGGEPAVYGILPDLRDRIEEAARRAHAGCDLVVISAGSSVSVRDITSDVIQSLGKPGVLIHGLAVKPGKPTILALCGRVPVIGLPGNPVSAFVISGLVLLPLIRRMTGETGPELTPMISARLTANVPSEAGREDYVAVRLQASAEGWLAEPVFGRSNLIFTLARAHGLIRVPSEATGIASGEQVRVRLL
jgi:molybdopterin molybdotransferase